jgi:phosphohistidine phosphatase
MRAFLVHHAEAVGTAVDPQRPLSATGRAQAEELARRAHASGCVPAVVWHSGKLRARQTAEAYWRACNPFADFRMVRGLRSEDPPEWMRDELAHESRDVMLVGHMPHIAALAFLLTTEADEFPLNGYVALERSEAGVWRLTDRAEATRRSG